MPHRQHSHLFYLFMDFFMQYRVIFYLNKTLYEVILHQTLLHVEAIIKIMHVENEIG